jgi:hypothetical protein
MKISKYVRIEPTARFNKLARARLKIQNKCGGQLYLVCTSYNQHLLFEIIKGQDVTDRHKDCYLVAVTDSKQRAVAHVRDLINELYNLRTISYEMIKT